MRREKAKHCFAPTQGKIYDFPISDIVTVVFQKILFKEFSLAKLKFQWNFLTLLTLQIRERFRQWVTVFGVQ